MATTTTSFKPRGVREVRVYRAISGVQTLHVFDAATTLTFAEQVSTSTMRGNDKIVSIYTDLSHIEATLEHGGLTLDAASIMFGHTVTSDATTQTLTWTGGRCFPYFWLAGKAVLDDCDGDVHVVLYRCKVSSPGDTSFADETFTSRSITIQAVADPSNSNAIGYIVKNDTATDLPSS